MGMDTIGLLLYKTTGATYFKFTGHYLRDETGLPHNSSNTPLTRSSSPSCSATYLAICDERASSSLKNACAARTRDSQSAISSFASAILPARSLSAFSVFAFLHGALSASLSSTRRISISGRDDESSRNKGVAGAVGSGSGGTVFDDEATGCSGRILMVGPVGRTAIRLVIVDVNYTVTHLVPSPSYLACSPSFPFSYRFALSTCCTASSVACTPRTFGPVCRCRTGRSCRTPRTPDGGRGARRLLAAAGRLPPRCHRRRRSV